MTHLQIETHFDDGHGFIEMRPQLDEKSWAIVHDLGIQGINTIVEREGTSRGSTGFSFDHSEKERLEKTAQNIGEALNQVGCAVSFTERPQMTPRQARTQRWTNRIIKRAALGLM